MGELSRRASDDDRERSVLALREHLVQGRLTLDEFSQRVEAAYRADTVVELAATAEELPAVPQLRGRRRPSRITAALFAHVVRRGRLRLPRHAIVLSGFADVDLDLREAEITSGRTTITAIAACGNVDVYVPEGIAVDVTGLTVVGHRREWGRDPTHPEAPVLRVRVVGLCGTVDVWRVPSELGGDYGEITRALQAGQR
ncbi:MAG: DUF1707 domain-containing protein [Gaiellaceae bacterium]